MTERATTDPLHSETLTDGERRALVAYVEKYGDQAAAERSGVSRLTLARAAAGLNVRRGSIELIRQAIQ